VKGGEMKQFVALEYFHTGVIQNGVSSRQLPNVECKEVLFKACSENKGRVFLGDRRVDIPEDGGVTNCECGFPLVPGESTEWIPIQNLSMVWFVCENAGDRLFYMVVK
jgi:hypothetical protein